MRLGLDIGSNSIGWWLYKTDDDGEITAHIDGGVRIFSDGRDPKSKASLAVARRDARLARRNRDRYLRRRAVLMKKMVLVGLMPANEEQRKSLELLDPYELRARGVYEKLSLHELGRALFHINQRRGFKSNRKTDKGDNEGGKIKSGAARLDRDLMTAGAKTYGAFLHGRRQSAADPRGTPSVRTRLTTIQIGEEGKEETGYDYYPTRAIYEEEFDTLWKKQAEHHRDVLSDALREEVRHIIFHQRPLKAPKVGRCLLEDEDRLPKAHPIFQELRLYQTINNLKIVNADQSERPLTREERDALILAARDKKEISFTALRKVVKLMPDQRFSLERGNRKNIEGDEVRAAMVKAYGKDWSKLTHDDQWKLIKCTRDEDDQDKLIASLQSKFGLAKETAENVANASLPDRYGRLGEIASKRILEKLKEDVVVYSEAAKRCGYDHSDDGTGEILDRLPYYGEILNRHVIPGTNNPKDEPAKRWGRITNPTVHIGLNQLRQLVNDIIKEYGLPENIVVELARDLKNSEKQKKEINTQIKKNTEAAIKRGEKIEELGVKDTGDARVRMRLWEESHTDVTKRRCPYCGKGIGARSVLNSDTDVDHILPYSKTLDDGISNKVLCHAHCNREKRNRAPYDAFAADPARWEIIMECVKNLPKNKQWRFGAAAMERFGNEEEFLARQLKDTQYLSRIARTYLARLYPDPKTAPVSVVPGRLTEMLRRHWGLNKLLSDKNIPEVSKEKNRQDHRHHAIDAAVVAATSRSLLKRISGANEKSEAEGQNQLQTVKTPWADFSTDMKHILDQIIVSHKPDHGTVSANRGGSTSGQLHNDTAYGIAQNYDGKRKTSVCHRKPLESLSEKDLGKIKDKYLYDKLWDATRDLTGKDFTAALVRFSQEDEKYRGIRRVRVEENKKVILIRDKDSKIYKGYQGDSNHCVEVWQMPDGKWKACVLSTFDANQKGLGATRPHPAAKLVMRLYKKDTVALEHPRLGFVKMYVAKITPTSNRIELVPFHETNITNRLKEKSFDYTRVTFSDFQEYHLRKIGVDRLGRVTDPGAKG